VSCIPTAASAGANSRLGCSGVLLAKKNEPARNASILLVSICLARLAMGRLADFFVGEFVHLSDLVCVVRLIA
jgi:hypothetical protein